MDRVALTRMQIRAVLTVFRSEGARLRRRYPEDSGADALERLRLRSLELLENARAELNGEAARRPELLRELESAHDEVSRGDDALDGHAAAEPVSVGSRGDRPG